MEFKSLTIIFVINVDKKVIINESSKNMNFD